MSVSHFKWVAIVILAMCLVGEMKAAILPGISGSSCCDDNSVSVNGVGKVSVAPDVAYITVGATVTAKTTQAATQKVAEKINQIIQILNNNKISKTDINTESIGIYPQYDYSTGVQTVTGQTASQTLVATVRKVDKNGGDLGKIIDQLVAVDGIQFSRLRFDKENKSEALKQARKIAVSDAKNKAADLAAFADRVLGKALTIVDSSSDAPAPVALATPSFALKADTVPTSVPVGDLDVFYSVNVKFALI